MKTTSPPSVEKRYNKNTLFDINDIVHKTTGATIKNSPEGMSYFIQSVSPDWVKETKLCELCASVVIIYTCYGRPSCWLDSWLYQRPGR